MFSFLGCKDDSDDDEQSYLLEAGIIPKTVYEKFRYYSSSQIDQCRAECLLYTKSGTYEKEIVDEDDLASELEFLTDSQIQYIKESYSSIIFFETTSADDWSVSVCILLSDSFSSAGTGSATFPVLVDTTLLLRTLME